STSLIGGTNGIPGEAGPVRSQEVAPKYHAADAVVAGTSATHVHCAVVRSATKLQQVVYSESLISPSRAECFPYLVDQSCSGYTLRLGHPLINVEVLSRVQKLQAPSDRHVDCWSRRRQELLELAKTGDLFDSDNRAFNNCVVRPDSGRVTEGKGTG